jgi:hypothetical protein
MYQLRELILKKMDDTADFNKYPWGEEGVFQLSVRL